MSLLASHVEILKSHSFRAAEDGLWWPSAMVREGDGRLVRLGN